MRGRLPGVPVGESKWLAERGKKVLLNLLPTPGGGPQSGAARSYLAKLPASRDVRFKKNRASGVHSNKDRACIGLRHTR